MITREPPSIHPENSCYSNSVVSMSLSACRPGHLCHHGLTVKYMSQSKFGPESDFCPGCNAYSEKIAITQKKARIWHFVAAQCDSGVPINIEKYNIASKAAVPLPGGRRALAPSSISQSKIDIVSVSVVPPLTGRRRAQDPPAPSAPAPAPTPEIAIAGYSKGNFNLLGSLCFSTVSSFIGSVLGDASAAVTVTYDNVTPNAHSLYLMVYDEAGLYALFNSKTSSYSFSEKECKRRQDLAIKTLPLHRGSHSETMTIQYASVDRGLKKAAVQLTFVIAQCSVASHVTVSSFKIRSIAAVDCANTKKCGLFEDCDTPVEVKGRRLRHE